MTARLVCCACVMVVLAGAVAHARPRTQIHYVMGTYFRITADGRAADAAMARCFTDARRLEQIFSRYDASSELRRVNAATTATMVSADFARLLAQAEGLRQRTRGAFDARVGALTAPFAGLSAPAATRAPRAVRLHGRRVALAPGTQLDFDGIAKGYAVDRCVGLLRAAGVGRALVDLGQSSVAAIGAPVGARAWELAVRGPDGETVVGRLRLRDVAASISAARHNGRSHIVDPARGTVIDDDAVGIVLARKATDAEAYTKALVLWTRGGPARVEALGAVAAVRLRPGSTSCGPRAVATQVYAALRAPRPLSPAEDALL